MVIPDLFFTRMIIPELSFSLAGLIVSCLRYNPVNLFRCWYILLIALYKIVSFLSACTATLNVAVKGILPDSRDTLFGTGIRLKLPVLCAFARETLIRSIIEKK